VSVDWADVYRTTYRDLVRFLHRHVWDSERAHDLAAAAAADAGVEAHLEALQRAEPRAAGLRLAGREAEGARDAPYAEGVTGPLAQQPRDGDAGVREPEVAREVEDLTALDEGRGPRRDRQAAQRTGAIGRKALPAVVSRHRASPSRATISAARTPEP